MIPEAQLETWQKQGPTKQFTDTYNTIRNVLNSTSSPYYNRAFEIYLQGSYANDTNVYGDSDVDIVICTSDVYYYDEDELSDGQKQARRTGFVAATFSWQDFRQEVLSWLRKNYDDAIEEGTKAIFVKGNGTTRRNADVIVCCEHRRYVSATEWIEGVCFFTTSGVKIVNYPKKHSENLTIKHQDTKDWLKPTIRIYKNLRNKLIADNAIVDDLAPSYFLEGLLYNVPSDRFGGTEQVNFKDVYDWIWTADRSKFVCANEQYLLLHDYSQVTWRAWKCDLFLGAVSNL